MLRKIAAVLLILPLLAACSDDEITKSNISTPEITLQSPSDAFVGQDFNLRITADATVKSATIAITLEPIPDGAQFVDSGNGTAILGWLPDSSDLGIYPVTVTATAAEDPTRID